MDLEKLKDEELCVLAKKGNTDAITVIYERYRIFAQKFSREYFISGGDQNDLEQEGTIGILSAVSHYDKDKHGLFKSYCIKSIKNAIFSAIRKSNTEKNKALVNYIPLSGLIGDDNAFFEIAVSYDGPETDFIDKENVLELKNNIVGNLSKFELKILKLFLDCYSYSEIAELTNKSVKSIDNAIQRIRRKIKEKI